MAVGIRIKFAGVTQDQFDAVNEHVDLHAFPGLAAKRHGTRWERDDHARR